VGAFVVGVSILQCLFAGGGSFLDLLKRPTGKPYIFRRHSYMALLLPDNITPFAIINARRAGLSQMTK
jgi:hypothetical protein